MITKKLMFAALNINFYKDGMLYIFRNYNRNCSPRLKTALYHVLAAKKDEIANSCKFNN